MLGDDLGWSRHYSCVRDNFSKDYGTIWITFRSRSGVNGSVLGVFGGTVNGSAYWLQYGESIGMKISCWGVNSRTLAQKHGFFSGAIES